RYQQEGELSRLLHQVLENVKTVPGVKSATLTTTLPGFRDWQTDIAAEGYKRAPGEVLINVDWSIVSADYFQTMGVPIIEAARLHETRTNRESPSCSSTRRSHGVSGRIRAQLANTSRTT